MSNTLRLLSQFTQVNLRENHALNCCFFLYLKISWLKLRVLFYPILKSYVGS